MRQQSSLCLADELHAHITVVQFDNEGWSNAKQIKKSQYTCILLGFHSQLPSITYDVSHHELTLPLVHSLFHMYTSDCG